MAISKAESLIPTEQLRPGDKPPESPQYMAQLVGDPTFLRPFDFASQVRANQQLEQQGILPARVEELLNNA